MSYFAGIAAVYWKDVLLEFRTRQSLSTMFTFCLTIVIIFNFVFEPGSPAILEVSPGVLWAAFTFSGLLGISRSFSFEIDKGGLQGLLLCPVERSTIYFGKVLGNVTFMLLIEAVTFPIFVIFYNLPPEMNLPGLVLVFFLGTLGFVAVGTLLSAISANTKAREVLLPVLLFPVAVPVLVATVKSTGPLLRGDSLAEVASWIKLLLAFDLLFLAASSLTFEYIVEE